MQNCLNQLELKLINAMIIKSKYLIILIVLFSLSNIAYSGCYESNCDVFYSKHTDESSYSFGTNATHDVTVTVTQAGKIKEIYAGIGSWSSSMIYSLVIKNES